MEQQIYHELPDQRLTNQNQKIVKCTKKVLVYINQFLVFTGPFMYGMLNLKLEKLQFRVSYSSLKRNIKQYFARYSSFFSQDIMKLKPHT